MRNCIWTHWDRKLGKSIAVPAKFHQWGTESEGDGDGNAVGVVTVAIIECPDGTIRTPCPCEVRFSDRTKPKGGSDE